MLQSALAGAERIFELMDQEPEYKDEAVKPEIRDMEGAANFNDVTFGYKKDTPVLKDVDKGFILSTEKIYELYTSQFKRQAS